MRLYLEEIKMKNYLFLSSFWFADEISGSVSREDVRDLKNL